MRMAAGDCLEDALDRHVFSRACTRIYERGILDCQFFLEVRRSEWSTRVHVRRVQHYTLLRLTFTTSEWDCCNLAVAYNIIAGCTDSLWSDFISWNLEDIYHLARGVCAAAWSNDDSIVTRRFGSCSEDVKAHVRAVVSRPQVEDVTHGGIFGVVHSLSAEFMDFLKHWLQPDAMDRMEHSKRIRAVWIAAVVRASLPTIPGGPAQLVKGEMVRSE